MQFIGSLYLIKGNIQRNSNEFGVSIITDHNSNSSPLTSTPLLKQSPASVGYPEVTLHPIKSSGQQAQLKQKGDSDLLANQSQSSSLLHGILTKVSVVVYLWSMNKQFSYSKF